MGVVALAHRDLRDLEEHLRAAISDIDGEENRLDRIVLYIDDLDRCDPSLVADVLDAVHLLLALRLFVVIVGVDPRWLERSLQKRHPVLLDSTPSESGIPATLPADYLEKIFQLTYTLPHMSVSNCADLLVAAARDTQVLSSPEDQYKVDNDERRVDSRSAKNIEDDLDAFEEGNGQRSHISAEDLTEALTLREDDMIALRDVAPLVSTSPRRAKRFLNVYLVIRARALGDPVLREHLNRKRDVQESVTDNTLMVLVALLLGLPKTMAKSIRDSQCDTGHAASIATSLTKMTTADEEARLQAFLSSAAPSITTLPMNAVMKWLPLARPYVPFGFD
jgi:hypothetical protein